MGVDESIGESGIMAEISFSHPSESEIREGLQNARNGQILGILKDGLVPSVSLEQSQSFFLGSTDRKPCEGVYGRVFKPRSQLGKMEPFYRRAIMTALYSGCESILPVVAERLGESMEDVYMFRASKADKQRIEARLTSSMLVVYRAKEGEGDEGSGYTRTPNETKAGDIVCVLVPREVMDSLRLESINGMGVAIKVVNRKIRRRVYGGDKLKIPDYEGEIIKLLKSQNESLWIHGVRLAAREDILDRRI